MPANNRLVYTGTRTSHFQVTCAMTITGAANNINIGSYLALNGTPVEASENLRRIANTVDVGSGAVSMLAELTTGDYVELWVENETDDENVTIEKMNLSVTEVG